MKEKHSWLYSLWFEEKVYASEIIQIHAVKHGLDINSASFPKGIMTQRYFKISFHHYFHRAYVQETLKLMSVWKRTLRIELTDRITKT